MGRLEGKVAVITGAGSGIGMAIASLFAKEGAVTVLAGRSRDKLERVHQNIEGSAEIYAVDISSEQDVIRFSSWLPEQVGNPDILVHSAGTVLRNEDMTKTGLAEWEELMAVNLKGPFLLAKYFIPLMKERGGGSIINIASQLAIISAPGYSTYSTAKGGVLSLTRSIAVDYGVYGIRANCISPGVIETPMAYVGRENFNEIKGTVASLHPLKRIGIPQDIANAALFLASDEAAWITGTNLVVDGGYTAQ